MAELRSSAFPLRYGIVDQGARYFFLDSYLPWVNFSHGKLRVLEKILEIELLEQINYWMKENTTLDLKTKQTEVQPCEHRLSKCCSRLHHPLDWKEEHFWNLLNKPVISNFGIDFPQANSLLVIRADKFDEEASNDKATQKTAKLLAKETGEDLEALNSAEDFLYVRYDPCINFYVLDVWGFYLSPRRGVKPSLVTSVLRAPASRSVAEGIIWKNHKKENPFILQPLLQQLPPQAIQVERHSCPLHQLYTKFHPSVPFLQDPDTQDEYLYCFVGLKGYQKYVDINLLEHKLRAPAGKKTKADWIDPEKVERIPIKFQIDDQIIKLASYPSANPTRRKEKDIKIYFGVSRTWSRASLLDPQHEDYIFQSKLEVYKKNMLNLSYPSVPQATIERFILLSPNPLVYKSKNSCYRGTTHLDSALKQFRKHFHS